MRTHDTRELWRPTRAHSVAGAHTVEVAWPWEQELGQGSVDQDTWMVSFVDILMLLLTLFVLLLAYQKGDSEQTRHLSAALRVSTPAQVSIAPALPAPVTVAQTEATALPQPQPATQAMQHAQASPEIQAQPERKQTQEQQPPLLPDAVPYAGTHTSPRIPMTEIAGMPGMFGLPPAMETSALTSTNTADAPIVHTGTRAGDPLHVPPQNSVDKLLADLKDSALQGRVEVNVLPDSIALEISDSILFAPASASLTEKGGRLLDELAATLKSHR
ncbi:MAG: hypothetical protein HZB57_03340 [Gammaproteobacteria bacterium]|nr:hypothetical protein [Gammaproteobacteria bacterium]